MKDVMLDLETLGRRAGCVVLSIGAVFFDRRTGELGREFYTTITRRSCKNLGLVEDPDTLDWWSRQSQEAQDAVFKRSGRPLADALEAFTKFLAQGTQPLAQIRVWGNGSDFDNAIIIAAYAAIGKPAPWEFWNNRCFRTLRDFAPHIKAPRVGVHHNALDDAKTQAMTACSVFSTMYPRQPEVVLVAAKTPNNVIGANGAMPWPSLKDDLYKFRLMTLGNTVIMGRKTFHSIPKAPLQGRRNIVISSTLEPGEGVEVFSSLANAFRTINGGTVFIIGGEQMYVEGMQMAHRIELTEIKKEFDGDAYFPPIDPKLWKETKRMSRFQQDILFDYVTYERRAL